MFKYYFRRILVLAVAIVLLHSCSEPAGQATSAAEIEKPGKCVLTPPAEPIVCTMQFDPVCGCDGKTYGNACSARAAGVPYSTPGACEEKTYK